MNSRFTVPLLLLFTLALFGCQEAEYTYAMGNIERDRISLSAPSSEQIVTVMVSEGEVVEKGDVLLQLEDRSVNALVAQREAELIQAKAALSMLTAGTRPEQLSAALAALDATQAASTEAELKYQRYSKLYQSNVIGKADLDATKANRDSTKAKAQQSYDQWLELKNGAREEDIQQASARVQGAQAALLWQRKMLEDLTIRAPVDGIIDTLPWHEGDRVVSGTQLVSLLSAALPYARVYLPANALTKVKAGETIEVFVDGVEDSLQGRIRNIRSQPAYTPFYALNERDRARLMYLTDIELFEADALPTGLAVEVRIP
ncbi:HlyD family efflux transporter periplasmic adaptor subunit [Marinomonas sp. 15G1-11]|uniref:HlyD family efflux transporter periplasmic adaptor subunit n=1 Tax=Marinomonas phaeophyticola TaxID=3004091 RepID=A0ABT4JVJ7_9GAMM|nr:HlyD family efflux transporter periplasmic adaptor subunit [Marinomonas sp. 15G1-11]MCZ2721589.1 HlyD family efflux transporter periplasmic adaptor subunit [Marinomonas sp. 15G1-11]